MPFEVFVDTGAWLALSDARDALHQEAETIYLDLLRQSGHLVTTILVVAETYEAIRRAGGHALAIRYLGSVRASTTLIRIYSDAQVERLAEDILRQFGDQRFSYVDAVSFAVMGNRKITQAFAFDHHFETAGFTLASAS